MHQGRLVRDGVPLEVNAYCRRANAKAVELAGPDGEVVVFTLGPPAAADALREMIACGADRGVHLCDPAFAGSDTLATAVALAAALRREGPFDLVLAGLNSLDSDTGQVPVEVAELLGLPFAAGARDLEVDGRTFTARLETDDGYCTVTGDLPAALSTAERLCAPSKAPPEVYAEVPDDRIVRLSAADLDVPAEQLGAPGSPTSVGPIRVLTATRPASAGCVCGPCRGPARGVRRVLRRGRFRLRRRPGRTTPRRAARSCWRPAPTGLTPRSVSAPCGASSRSRAWLLSCWARRPSWLPGSRGR